VCAFFYAYLGRVGVRVGVTLRPLKIKTINYKKYTHIHTRKQASKYSLFPWSPDPNTHTHSHRCTKKPREGEQRAALRARERTHLLCIHVSVGSSYCCCYCVVMTVNFIECSFSLFLVSFSLHTLIIWIYGYVYQRNSCWLAGFWQLRCAVAFQNTMMGLKKCAFEV